MKIILWALYFVLFAYGMNDAASTEIILNEGLTTEANPMMNYFINTHGMISMFYIKLAGFGLLGFLLAIYTRRTM